MTKLRRLYCKILGHVPQEYYTSDKTESKCSVCGKLIYKRGCDWK